ncbi:MAG: HAMP domain-containing sensor histidine kinase [Pseudoxanthomonas suwonensis]|nr:HAMP domain-containing sensor histidine kinase [Pseudoxanthomonas suwonensis]
MPEPAATDNPDRQALLELQRMQQVLAHGIAHDLRAPLRVIDGFARHLEQGSGEALDADGREQLQRIRAAAGRMGGLIDLLLDYLRAGSAELHTEPVDLSLLADWTGAELADADPGRVLRIDVDEGLEAWGDERQYKRLFELLLDNATRFTPADRDVCIEVRGQREGDRLQLRVSDHGSGFDPAYATRVFEPFQRAHGSDAGGGHGMGLAVAKAIVERAGGHIHAAPVPGEGCTIHVELPASAPAPAPGAPASG